MSTVAASRQAFIATEGKTAQSDIQTRAVIIPFFAGLGIGVGISVKRVGIGIPWIRIHSGIESTAGIGSTLL